MNTKKQAIDTLKSLGYYVDNLWHIDDVQQNYKLDNDDAYEVLDTVMQSEWMISNIFEMIDLEVKEIEDEQTREKLR
jgi:hypothetical protein